MNRDQKAAVIDEVAVQISKSEAVYAVDYRGISVPQAAELRTKLRDADASFRVVKNTLGERAADKAGAEALKELLDGPTAMTFVQRRTGAGHVPAPSTSAGRSSAPITRWRPSGDPIVTRSSRGGPFIAASAS